MAEDANLSARLDGVVRRPCVACPFRDGETEEATMGQNHGCLPSSFDMVAMFRFRKTAMSCHENDTTACRGLASVRDVSGAEVYPYSEWYHNG